jgi:hypothetical protein
MLFNNKSLIVVNSTKYKKMSREKERMWKQCEKPNI